MIAYPIDSSLIRDHIYHDTNDLDVVLNPETFFRDGAFKRMKDYGLGYFNYQFQIDQEIYTVNSLDHWRAQLYDHFIRYLVCVLVVAILWGSYFILDWQWVLHILAKLPLINTFIKKQYRTGHNKYNQEEFEYHYIK